MDKGRKHSIYRFDKKKVRRLVEMVKGRPSLYDESISRNRMPDLKLELWTEIAREIFKSEASEAVEAVKQKWKSIRDSFTKSFKLYVMKKAKGMEPQKPLRYDCLEFLIPHLNSRLIVEALTKNEDQLTNDDPLDFVDVFDEDDEPEDKKPKNILMLEEEAKNIPKEDFTYEATSSDQRTHPAYSSSTMQGFSEGISPDETEAFFQSLAKTVKRLKPLNQALVKKTIANVILDMEIREAGE